MDNDLFDSIHEYLKNGGEDEESDGVFTEDEYNTIILSFLSSRGETGASEEEVLKVVRECEKIAIGYSILELLFKRLVDITLKDGELAFSKAGTYEESN